MPNAPRRGAALAIALVALVVIAGVGAGAALAAREGARTARDDLARVRAATDAQSSLETAIRPWDRRRNQLAVGAIDSSGTVFVERLDATRFLVEASASARASTFGAAGVAAHTVSALLRLAPVTTSALGAVTTAGPLSLASGASIDGRDAAPNGWAPCAPLADTAAIVAADTSVVRTGAGVVIGAVRASAVAASPATYASFASDDWTSLTARADVVLGAGAYTPNPRAAGSACTIAADGWSEPLRGGGSVAACASTFPIVYAPSSVVVHGPARAQGVLLVDGDLTLDGSVTFAGVVVVRGAVHADAAALQLDGVLLARDGVSLGAGSRVRYSRCATTRATDGVARVTPFGRRSWAEVTR